MQNHAREPVGIGLIGYTLVGIDLQVEQPIRGQKEPKPHQRLRGELYFTPQDTAPSGLPTIEEDPSAPLHPLRLPFERWSEISRENEQVLPVTGLFSRRIRDIFDQVPHIRPMVPPISDGSENGNH